MSLPSESLPIEPASRATGTAADLSRATHRIDGLDGAVELRRAPGGYLQVWPRPRSESLRELYAEDFYDREKPEYLSKVQREKSYWDATWSMRRKLMESALAPTRRRLLDVGSSGGFLLDHFKAHGWQCVGIEPSHRAAAFAREQYGLEIFTGELLDYDVGVGGSDHSGRLHRRDHTAAEAIDSEQRFDAIHSSQVLEHVLEPEAFIERIASLLRPNGVTYIEVPNEFNVFQETARERLGKSAWWVAPRHHLNYFDYESLAALLDRHGLVEIDRLASFPIEIFLLMGDDYVGQPEVGSACHQRRMKFERSLIETGRTDDLLRIYRTFAQAGLGRTCGILARKLA